MPSAKGGGKVPGKKKPERKVKLVVKGHLDPLPADAPRRTPRKMVWVKGNE